MVTHNKRSVSGPTEPNCCTAGIIQVLFSQMTKLFWLRRLCLGLSLPPPAAVATAAAVVMDPSNQPQGGCGGGCERSSRCEWRAGPMGLHSPLQNTLYFNDTWLTAVPLRSSKGLPPSTPLPTNECSRHTSLPSFHHVFFLILEDTTRVDTLHHQVCILRLLSWTCWSQVERSDRVARHRASILIFCR